MFCDVLRKFVNISMTQQTVGTSVARELLERNVRQVAIGHVTRRDALCEQYDVIVNFSPLTQPRQVAVALKGIPCQLAVSTF